MDDEIDDVNYEQLESEDTLDYRGPQDPLDEGYSPAEKPWAVDDWGTTAREELEGEGLDRRLAREVPDVEVNEDDDGLGDAEDTDGELLDDEVGDGQADRGQPVLGVPQAGQRVVHAVPVGPDGVHQLDRQWFAEQRSVRAHGVILTDRCPSTHLTAVRCWLMTG